MAEGYFSRVEGPREMVALMARKFAELCLMATILAVPFAYQFSLPPRAILWVSERMQDLDGGRFFSEQIHPYLTGAMPTLETKFSAWAVLGLLMIAAHIGLRVFQALCRMPVDDGVATERSPARQRLHRIVPLAAGVIFLAYSLAGIMLWAPDVPPEARALLGGEHSPGGALSRLGGGGFFYSAVSWLQVAFALLFLVVAEDLIRDRRFVTKILGVLLFSGVVNAITVLLLKLEFGPLMDIWVRFDPTAARNNLGGFIGHNTGVSSYLMAPFLVAIMWMLSVQPRRRRTFRIGLALAALLMMMALLLAQSRAVVPIVVAMGILLAVLLVRRGCLEGRSRLYIWFPVAFCFLVLTQLIPSRMNPLFREDVTLQDRIGEFRPERLITETRLRILCVSLWELIPQAPILGHGFASFQYVYPKAQGAYFEAFPNSRLAPTPFRTPQAHNEYLQLLIESGVVGTAIVAVGLFFLLRGGWIVYRRTLMPHHISVEIAVLCSIGALLLHSIFDFPMRVPPLAHTLVILLAVWSAGDRLWIFPMRPPVDEAVPLARDPEAEPVRSLVRFVRPVLGLAAVVGCLAAGAAGIVYTVARFQSVETQLARAEALLRQYAVGRSLPALDGAAADIRAARRVFWIHGTVHRFDAQSWYYMADINFDRADAIAAEGGLEVAAAARALARTYARNAIQSLNMSLAEERFHGSYVLRYTIHRLLAHNSLGPERDGHQADAEEDLLMAVRINPGDPTIVFALVQEYERNLSQNSQMIQHYMQVLHHFHPSFFQKEVVGRVLDARALGQNEDAYRKLLMIERALPGDPEYQPLLAQTALSAGDYATATRVANQLLDSPATSDSIPMRENARMVLLQKMIRQGDREAARREVERMADMTTVSPAMLRAMHLFLLDDTREDRELAQKLRTDLLRFGAEHPMNFQIVGLLALNWFDSPEDAIEWMERRRAVRSPAPPMDQQGYYLLATAYARTGQWEQVRELLQPLRTTGLTPYSSFLGRVIADSLERQIPAPPVANDDPGEEAP